MLAIIEFQGFSAPLWGSGDLGFKSQHSDLVKNRAEQVPRRIPRPR